MVRPDVFFVCRVVSLTMSVYLPAVVWSVRENAAVALGTIAKQFPDLLPLVCLSSSRFFLPDCVPLILPLASAAGETSATVAQ